MFASDTQAPRRERLSPFSYGRFMQTDPVGYNDQINMYAYVGNDPINVTDPSGMESAFSQSECQRNSSVCSGWSGSMPTAQNKQSDSKSSSSSSTSNSRDTAQAGRHPYSKPTTGDDDEIVVTGSKMIPDSQRWVLVDGRYYANPYYQRPWYDIGVDGFIGIQVAGFATAGGLAALPALSETMAVSQTFGVASSRFGNNFYRGGAGQGSWNYGSVRLGWSFNARTGNVYFQPRIGDFHVPTPIFTSAPW